MVDQLHYLLPSSVSAKEDEPLHLKNHALLLSSSHSFHIRGETSSYEADEEDCATTLDEPASDSPLYDALDHGFLSSDAPPTPLLARLYGHNLLPTSGFSASRMDIDRKDASSSSVDIPGDPPELDMPGPSLPLSSSISRSSPISSPATFRGHQTCAIYQRIVYVRLASDAQFLTTLADTVASIEALEMSQKREFAGRVENLVSIVRKVAAPNSRSDLYRWRDIFGLYVEAEVFQGRREQDRSERDYQTARDRLFWFADQVGKRNLASSMCFKDSKVALDGFIELNQSLLDLKVFVDANQTAIRKILKKHDKRTSLHALSSFPDLFPSRSSDGQPTFLLASFSTLPQIILATLTDTLLPIVPQLDDFNCLICSEVAYRPVRLRQCGHSMCLK